MSSDYVLEKLEELERRVKMCEEHEHAPGYHDHLLDEAEHAAHHARLDKPKEKRQGERRGEERRKSTEAYTGEERRA